MNLKNFFKIVLLSFYSPELYLSVIGKWRHWGLNFLLKFSVLVTLIASIILFTLIAMIDFNSDSIKTILNNIPELRISENKASFVNPDIKSPVFIQPGKSVQNIIIIDLDTDDAGKYQNSSLIVFVSDRIVLNLLQASPISLTYKDLMADSDVNIVDGDFLINFLNTQQKNVLGIILFVGIPLGSLIYFVLTLIKVGFYSSVTSLVVMIFKLNLTFKQLTRLAIIANIPAVFVSSIFSVLLFQSGASETDEIIVTFVQLFYFVGAIILYLRRTKEVY